MYYAVSMVVPAGTSESSPVTKTIKLAHGVITYIGIGFPKDCKQRVKARVYHHETQIFPTNPDEPASWDGDIIGGQMHQEFTSAPFLLRLIGYAPAATKDHTITFLINLLPVEVAEPWREQISVLDRIKQVFGLK
jgi:hypothetical protein